VFPPLYCVPWPSCLWFSSAPMATLSPTGCCLRCGAGTRAAASPPDTCTIAKASSLSQPPRAEWSSRNCSLTISDLRRSDSGTYVFYFITNHPVEESQWRSLVEESGQPGVTLLVAGKNTALIICFFDTYFV
jgi:hypothetical protein